MKRFTVLDSFRGICALCVVFHHFNITGSMTELSLFRNATYMVEFFFVLSGFVLTHAYSKREFDWNNMRSFAISRTFRLFPLHIFMLVVFILLELIKFAAQSKGIYFNKPAFSGVNAPIQILPNFLLLQAWLPSAATLSFNYPSWSISIEYYLYVIFAILMFSLRKVSKTIVLAFFAISTISFIALVYPIASSLKVEALNGLSCFFGGAVTYFIYKRVKPKKIGMLSFSFLEIVMLLLCYCSVTMQYELKGVVTSLVFCMTIYIFSFEAGIVSSLLSKSFFEFFGKISFSIYMTHAAVIFIAISIAMACEKFFGKEFTYSIATKSESTIRYMDLGSGIYNNILAVIIISIVIVVSYFTYIVIELRSISAGKRFSKKTTDDYILKSKPDGKL
ncbi:acyltransferase family protein [Serratia proteamaculans]|uniref:acyltransferase family protein n=1 Tax=Serratia proteamaculans TaxID=28151 RepID=UPI00217A08E2|nr:acyltransferase [Serratia proteamaculans]CAI1722372.1 Acyltransferase family [Serratia proteamaculans]